MPQSATALRSPHAALQFRDFRLFQTARLASVISSEMISVAVGWQVYAITNRARDLGYVGLAQFLPSFLLFLVAGHTVDRFDRRRVLQCVQFTYALCAGLLLFYTLSGERSVSPIFIILALQGTVRAFGGPAGQAFMPQLVPEEVFANAVTWGSSAFQVATIIGPGIGGLLYGWIGASGVYALTAVGYLASFVFTTAIRTRTGRMEHRSASLETLLAGLHYVWDNQIILGSISLDLFAVLLGGATALLPVFARDILRTGPWGLGLLRCASSAGALAVALLLAFRPLRRRAGVAMLCCVAIFGVATIGFGLSRSIALSVLCLVIVGGSDMVSVVVRQTLVQINTPPEMRGRVSSVNMLFIGTSNQLGEFESGVTAQWWGAVRATVIGGIGTLVVVAAWWNGFPRLRRIETLEAKTEAIPGAGPDDKNLE